MKTTGHYVDYEYSLTAGLPGPAFAWFCSCGVRGPWFPVGQTYDHGVHQYASKSEDARMAAVLDSRSHAAAHRSGRDRP